MRRAFGQLLSVSDSGAILRREMNPVADALDLRLRK